LYGDGGGAHALANADGTSSTDAAMGALRIAPLPGGGATGAPVPPAVPALPGQEQTPVDTSLFSSGSVQSTTANFFDGSTGVTHVESRIDGLRVFGGLVTIDSITSIAETRYPAKAQPVGASSTTVQGVKVLGQDATIDDQGLHAANPSDNDQITKALADNGLSMHLVGATQGFDDKGFITAQSEGVVLEFRHTVDNAPSLPSPPENPAINVTSPNLNGQYFVKYNFASVSARTFERDLTFGGGSFGGGGGSSASFSTSAGSGSAAPSGFTGGTVSSPAPPATGPGGDGVTGATTAFLGLDAGKVKLLYLAFTLATLGVALVPRLALPARLPGASKA
jgi:hypothetical protein